MANAVYDKAAEGAWKALIDWVSDDIRGLLIDTGAYTFSAAHEFLSDVPSGARLAAAVALSGKTVSGRTLQATSPLTFPTVAAGTDVTALILYKHTGSDATARLILYIDTAYGLPAIRNGLDIRINWNTGANKILKV